MTARLAETVGQAKAQLQESQGTFDAEVHHAILQEYRHLMSSLAELHPESNKPKSKPLSPPSREELTLLPAYERTPGYSFGIQKRFPRRDGCHDQDNAGEFCYFGSNHCECLSFRLTLMLIFRDQTSLHQDWAHLGQRMVALQKVNLHTYKSSHSATNAQFP